MYRWRVVRARMPFWKVVVEAAPDRTRASWPVEIEGVVTTAFVWARTIEEAEGLARLALEADGLSTSTADAVRATPDCRPATAPEVARLAPYGFYGGLSVGGAPFGGNPAGQSSVSRGGP
jgi:hypothetical protein